MFNFNDPNTFWLNVTNIVLGLVTLICCVAVGRGVLSGCQSADEKARASESR